MMYVPWIQVGYTSCIRGDLRLAMYSECDECRTHFRPECHINFNFKGFLRFLLQPLALCK